MNNVIILLVFCSGIALTLSILDNNTEMLTMSIFGIILTLLVIISNSKRVQNRLNKML